MSKIKSPRDMHWPEALCASCSSLDEEESEKASSYMSDMSFLLDKVTLNDNTSTRTSRLVCLQINLQQPLADNIQSGATVCV